MALKKPLVIYSGLPGQIISTDTLDVPGVAAGDVVQQTNDEAGPIVIGTPVYNDANDGVKKAKGDASGTKDVMGLVKDVSITNAVAGAIQTTGILAATTAQWDTVFGTSGGLTKGTRYFLSAATSGLGTSTAPSTVGQFVVLLGIALSTTELSLASPFTPIAL
jgi:hypothetical protein